MIVAQTDQGLRPRINAAAAADVVVVVDNNEYRYNAERVFSRPKTAKRRKGKKLAKRQIN